MATATVQAPDGRTFTVEVPEGATEEQILDFVRSQAEPEAVATAATVETQTIPQAEPAEQAFTAAETEANEILGVDPNIVERGVILPFGRNEQGQTEFAVPEIALGVARSLLLPGQAFQGTETGPSDVTNLALNVTAPGSGAALARRAAPKIRTSRLTAQQIADAPTSLDITKGSGRKFRAARQAGANLKADDYVGFLAGAERDLVDEGIDSVLHPKLTAVFNALTKKIGTDLDAQDLHKVRRTIRIATESLDRDEARIARVLRNNFDDFVERLPGTPEWVEARKLYVQARKAETIENAINRAESQASGIENGLRVQFRSLLNNERKMRNFTKAEKKALKRVVDGDFTANTLKKIGRLGFGSGQQSNFLGGTIGITGGGVLGGPVGAATAPLIGAAAQRGAQRRTMRAADTLRALIGGARPEPRVPPGVGAVGAVGALGAATEAQQRGELLGPDPFRPRPDDA